MSGKPLFGWHNFVTGETDYRESAPQTDEEAIQYLPQIGGPGMFRILREQGLSINDAMLHVLKVATREKE